MKDYIRPLSLSIVDFLGIIIPGIIFFSEIIILQEIIFLKYIPQDSNPLKLVIGFINHTSDNVIVSWLVFIFFGLLIGYLFKPFVMSFAERLSVLFSLEAIRNKKNKKRSYYSFPFTEKLKEETKYFATIEDIIKNTAKMGYEDLPKANPYSYCKRYLKLLSPNLWEECEHLEAEVRMIGSSFLASIFSAFLSVVTLMVYKMNNPIVLYWFFISVIFTIIMGVGLRKRRNKEVEYTYLLMIVLNAGISQKNESTNR
jgi:hypothetical protein